MLSRVAESVYWMSRYIERAENVARMVHVNVLLQLDRADPSDQQWDPLVKVSGADDMFKTRYDKASRVNVIQIPHL